MSTRRLKQRTVSARPVTVAILPRHRLAFHKVSKIDHSGKCDIAMSTDPADRVIGIVYDINPAEKPVLDAIEGLGDGYEAKEITVFTDNNTEYNAFTYYATHIDETLKPYHWYKEHVLRGAKEHGLPMEYIDRIVKIESIDDPDGKRSRLQLNIYTVTD